MFQAIFALLLAIPTYDSMTTYYIASIVNPPHGCANFGLCTVTEWSLVPNATNVTEYYEYTCPADDCVCVNGTSNGTTTCNEITNLCTSDPCSSSNTSFYYCAMTGINSYDCTCEVGYYGATCSLNASSPCASSPCQNGGTCKEDGSDYKCTCPAYYTGPECESYDPCYNIDCKNGAECESKLNDTTFYCNCTDTWQGPYCDDSTVQISIITWDQCWHYDDSLASYTPKFSDSKMTVDMCQTFARNFTPQLLVITLCGTWCAASNESILSNSAWLTDSGCGARCPGDNNEYCGKMSNRAIEYSYNADVIDPDGCVNDTQCSENLGYGVCVDIASTSGDGYSCRCDPYHTGTYCNISVASACSENPCNTGTCNLIYYNNSYTCTCPSDTVGDNCQYSNPCTDSPCLYGGTCVADSSGGYTCECLEYYTGDNCQYIDRCKYNDPCVHGTCNCDTSSISPNYTCTCQLGWNNTNCDTEIDFCDSTPCAYNSTCTAYFGGYNCTCLEGLKGYNCSEIIDQCKVQAVDGVSPCNTKDTNANCTTGINTFTCSCSSEWTDTLCDLSVIIKTVLVEIYGYVDTDMISMLEDLMSNPSEIVDMVPFITGLLNETERESLSWDVEDLFYWIAFEDKRLDMNTDIYKWNDVVLGNCFTFNHYDNNITYNMRNDGRHGGLYANMRCRQDEYAPWYDTASINVFIHSRDEYVFSESVRYNAPPNAKSNINIYNTYYTKLGGKYGVCITNTSQVKDYYYPLGYSTDGCLRTCYQDMIYAACGCMDPRYPQNENYPTCELANRTCVTDASDAAGDPSTWPSCVCPLPCAYQQFSVTWSKADFVDNPVSCQSATNQTACLETYQDSLLVSIVLPQLSYQLYAETANMDFNKFLSQLGGQLGVLMGINIVSFIELVFLTAALFSVCCKKYH